VVWKQEALDALDGRYGDEVNVAGCVHGKDEWGHRVYRFALPATKASAFGFSGRTHLVAQLWGGEWRARTLSATEIGKIFGSSRVDLEVDEDDDRALRDYGNGGPLRMVLPFADALVSHFAPPSDFVPQSVGEIVSGTAVTAFRGAMDLTYADFLQKAKLN